MGRLTHSWPPMDVYVAFLLGRGLILGWPQVSRMAPDSLGWPQVHSVPAELRGGPKFPEPRPEMGPPPEWRPEERQVMGRLTHPWPPMDVSVAFLLGRGLAVGWPQVPVAPSFPAEIDLGDPTRICGAVTVSWGLPSFMESSSLEDHAADRRGPRSMEFALVRWLFSRPSRCRGQLV